MAVVGPVSSTNRQEGTNAGAALLKLYARLNKQPSERFAAQRREQGEQGGKSYIVSSG